MGFFFFLSESTWGGREGGMMGGIRLHASLNSFPFTIFFMFFSSSSCCFRARQSRSIVFSFTILNNHYSFAFLSFIVSFFPLFPYPPSVTILFPHPRHSVPLLFFPPLSFILPWFVFTAAAFTLPPEATQFALFIFIPL